jgi:hypothetical protein
MRTVFLHIHFKLETETMKLLLGLLQKSTCVLRFFCEKKEKNTQDKDYQWSSDKHKDIMGKLSKKLSELMNKSY